MSTSAPISPTARANASATPERIPGRMFGSTMLRKTRRLAGAERARGLLRLVVELEQHGLHRAHDERQRHEEQREHDRRARERDVDADRRLRAVEREQRQAARRSSAARTAGRSRALTMLLPRKSSRTSTHAVIVPSTAFTADDDQRRAEAELQRRDRLGSRDDRPELRAGRSARDAQTSAAIGSSDDHREIGRREAEREGRSGPLARTTCCTAARSRAACAVLARGRSSDRCARSATMRPLFGSNQSLSAVAPAADVLSSIVKMPGRVGYLSAYFAATFLSTGRKPYCAKRSCAVVALHEADELVRPCPCSSSTSCTAIGSSISIDWRGITYWMSWPLRRELIASLS